MSSGRNRDGSATSEVPATPTPAPRLATRRAAFTAEGHSQRRRVNERRNSRPRNLFVRRGAKPPFDSPRRLPGAAVSSVSPPRRFLAKAPAWPDHEPFSRNQRARCRTGNRPPTSAIDPKLEHTHERSSPRLPDCFSRPEVSGRRAPVTRLASTCASWLPSWRRQILRTDRSAFDSARRKAPVPTRRLNQTLASQDVASLTLECDGGTQLLPRPAYDPPRERSSFRTNQSAFCYEGLAREKPGGAGAPSLRSALNRAFCTSGNESAF